VPRQVGKYSYRFDLYLFVLGGQNVKLYAIENSDPNFIREQLLLWNIIKQKISNARDGVKNEFFVFVDGSFVDGFYEAGDELVVNIFEAYQVFAGILFLSGEVRQQLDHLCNGILQVASAELLILLGLGILARLLFFDCDTS
jgi:hypothetical protein